MEAMNRMRELMQSRVGMAKWMADKRKQFDARSSKK